MKELTEEMLKQVQHDILASPSAGNPHARPDVKVGIPTEASGVGTLTLNYKSIVARQVGKVGNTRMPTLRRQKVGSAINIKS